MIPTYTKEQAQELIAWFDEHIAEFPQEVVFLDGAKTSDFPTTYKSYRSLILNTLGSPTYNVYVHHLMLVKEAQKRP